MNTTVNFKALGSYKSCSWTNCTFLENGSEILKRRGKDEPLYKISADLPIDMQFNNGNLLSVIGYSVLMFISAVGNVSVGYHLLR